MVWDLRGAVKFAVGANAQGSVRAGSECREREWRPQTSGQGQRGSMQGRRKTPWSLGAKAREPRPGLDFFLVRDLETRQSAGLPAFGAESGGWLDTREGGARGPAGGSGRLRPGGRAGWRAHTGARTLCRHTWSSFQERGGEESGGECPKIERQAEERERREEARRRAGARRAGSPRVGTGRLGADAPPRDSAPGPAGSAR